jgi:Amidohydrolase
MGRDFVVLIRGLSMVVAGGLLAVTCAGQTVQSSGRSLPVQAGFTSDSLKEFISIEPIDIHTHIYRNDPEFSVILGRLHLHVLDVLVADVKDDPTHRTFDSLKQGAWEFVASNAGRVSMATNFDPFAWNESGFPDTVTASMDKDFDRGAVAATIWINPGMRMMDGEGKPALPDDARLEMVYKDMVRRHKTLMAHLTGAEEAWAAGGDEQGGDQAAGSQAVRQNASEASPISAMLQARDRILELNPKLRVVGAHLGSVREDMGETGRRMERYPNFAVDTSGRLDYLMTQPREQVVAYFLKFQDRILYGSDMGFRKADVAEKSVAVWESRYASDWRYLSSDDTFEYKGREVHGLHLPMTVLRKLYHDNAVRWVPGVAQ